MSNIEQKYYTIVSNKGKQAVIKALANKELIDLTTMSVGDGESPIDTNWESLPNEKDKFGITQIKIVDNITLEVTGILSAQKGGYMIRQAGLYTSDDILFAIAQLPQTAKPVLSDGASKDMTIKFVITIADTSVVNLSIDPNINIITQSRLDEVIELNANELRVEIEDKVDALKKETTTNLATKADKSVTYTKTEVNNLVNAKADKTTTYTKTEVNNLVNAKENKNVAKGLVDALKIELNNKITTTKNEITRLGVSAKSVSVRPANPYGNRPSGIGIKNYSYGKYETSIEGHAKFNLYSGDTLLMSVGGNWIRVNVTCNNNNN